MSLVHYCRVRSLVWSHRSLIGWRRTAHFTRALCRALSARALCRALFARALRAARFARALRCAHWFVCPFSLSLSLAHSPQVEKWMIRRPSMRMFWIIVGSGWHMLAPFSWKKHKPGFLARNKIKLRSSQCSLFRKKSFIVLTAKNSGQKRRITKCSIKYLKIYEN